MIKNKRNLYVNKANRYKTNTMHRSNPFDGKTPYEQNIKSYMRPPLPYIY